MDTSKYIKKCPRCGTDIEPERCATLGDKIWGGVSAVSGAVIGLVCGGPVGGAIGAFTGYKLEKHTMMSCEDDYNEKQWFKYKCPNCGTNWKEKIHTNDNPDDISPLINGMGW